ncbi:MAG: GNAT family N-acetyltransferase [Chloroflexi bacterium]|nr:MAG: GNAT family N-acetyltransferase [Chloroflexota bacterium]TME86692.1 MAG: GNAT family N-acetyltransferase [Chloroflexota bacterium]
MLVRRAGLGDVDDLAPLFDLYRQFYGQASDLAAARAFLSERLRRDESVIFIASADDVALGFTQLYPSFSSVSVRRLWILNDLFVSPAARRGGVGRRLLERAREWAVETGAKGLTLTTALTNSAARSLYESCGWRLDDEFAHYQLLV